MGTDNQMWKDWLKNERDKVTSTNFDFSLFKIQCQKCTSTNTEINGDCEADGGWYDGDIEDQVSILVKCHDCGNAMFIRKEYEGTFKGE